MDKSMLWILSIFLLVELSKGQNDAGNIEDSIREVFNIGGPPVGDRGDASAHDHGEGGEGGCLCVPYFMCNPDDNSIITDGSTDGFGQIDIRFGQKCTHYLDVCCEPDRQRPTTPPVTPPVTPSVTPAVTPAVTPSVTPSVIPPTRPPVTHTCGTRNVNGVSFHIVGGVSGEAQFAEFPWMVALLRRNWNPSVHPTLAICGGSLIHPQVVLTGAHCVHELKASDIKIRAGEWDTQTTKEILPYHERNVANIIKHNEYFAKSLYNDIALLVLDSPLVYADNVGTVCLPLYGVVSTSKDCLVSGWGKTEFARNASYQVILKKIDLPMVSHSKCQDALRKTRLGVHFNLHNSFVCAGGEAGKDVCEGDGGGPLVCPGPDNKYEQTGIVAWGIGCGQSEVPGVYTNVALFRNWIDQQMNTLGYGIKSYTS